MSNEKTIGIATRDIAEGEVIEITIRPDDIMSCDAIILDPQFTKSDLMDMMLRKR